MSDGTWSGSRMVGTLALLGGMATLTVPAHAAFISTAGGAGLPVVFDGFGGSQIYALDLNADGVTDYTISVTAPANGNNGWIDLEGGANSVITPGGGSAYVYTFASTASFPATNSPSNVSNGTVHIAAVPRNLQDSGFSYFHNSRTYAGTNSPAYAELLFTTADGTRYTGYLEGTLDDAAAGAPPYTFTLNDFGYDPGSAVALAEPASLTLLGLGLTFAAFTTWRRAVLAG